MIYVKGPTPKTPHISFKTQKKATFLHKFVIKPQFYISLQLGHRAFWLKNFDDHLLLYESGTRQTTIIGMNKFSSLNPKPPVVRG